MSFPSSVGSVYTSPATPASSTHTPDPAQEARAILQVGSRSGTDDYDARLIAFSKAAGQGDDAYRKQLMTALFKDDPGALASWLQPQRAEKLFANGSIDQTAEGNIAESIATAYNNGSIPSTRIYAGQVPYTDAQGYLEQTDLEASLLGDFYTRGGLGGVPPDTLSDAQSIKQFIDFFNTSSGPETSQFRQNFGKQLINNYVLNPAVSYNNPTQQQAAALLAANLISGDLNHPDIVAKTLGGLSDSQVQTFLDSAAHGADALGTPVISGLAKVSGKNPNDYAIYDGAALMLDDLALDHSAAGDRLAVTIAKFAGDDAGIFQGDAGQGRLDGLTMATSSHAKAIFDTLTNFDTTNTQSQSDTNSLQYKTNATQLASLFQLTLFNSKSADAPFLQQQVVNYTQSLVAQINKPGENPDAVGKLAMLQSSLSDAITKGYDKLNSDEASRKQILGFVLDLGLSVLPIGKWTSGAAEKVIMDTFPNNDGLQNVLKTLSGKLIDTATGKLTDAAKEKILDKLGSESGSLEIAKNSVNNLNLQTYNNITDNSDKTDVKTDYVTIYNSIS